MPSLVDKLRKAINPPYDPSRREFGRKVAEFGAGAVGLALLGAVGNAQAATPPVNPPSYSYCEFVFGYSFIVPSLFLSSPQQLSFDGI